MDKCIITVVGKDAKGIIAKVCSYLANNEINILDISQTIVGGYFNMMMIVDVAEATIPFLQLHNELDECGRQLGVQVKCQREDIFEKMHRI
ncbi:MAG: ACT domain-containing protein [Bacteroidaceae bacterium]|nr:ACT domain-containing protein [Bacteroidaceae bacterium]